MSLAATARSSRIAWYVGYTVLCLGFGIWGGYDYWVRIPHEDAEYVEFSRIKSEKDALETQSQNPSTPLSVVQIAAYERAKMEFRRYASGAPEPVPVYDRPLQLWVYVVGCGVLGTPYFIWQLLQLRRRRIDLADNGDLTVDGATLASADITGIDMSKWMSKSIAKVVGTNERSLVLDDYLLKDAHFIVGRLAHQFHPDQWKEDATKVKAEPEADERPIGAGGDGDAA